MMVVKANEGTLTAKLNVVVCPLEIWTTADYQVKLLNRRRRCFHHYVEADGGGDCPCY